jgi:DNA replication factor GINS
MMDLDELRSAQSRERQASQLQHLRDGFYEEAASFIRGLRTERERAAESSAYDFPYDDPEVKRLTDEIGTAEEVVESLYERRVGKVVKMASFDAAGMAVDADGLTAEESDLFAQLVGDIEANRSRVLDALAGKGGGSAAEGSSGTAAAGSTPGIPDEAGAERAGASDQTGGDAPPHGEAPAPDEPVHIGNGPAADGPVSTADEASSTDQAADRAPTPEGGAAAGPETDDVDAQPAGGPGDAPSDAMDAASAMGGDSTGRSEAVPGGVPKAPPESGVSAAEADASAPPTADDTTATSATEVVTDDAGVEDGRQPVPPADGPQGSDPTPEPGSGSTTAGTSGTDDHSSGTASTAGTSTPAAESSGTGDGPTSGSDGAEPAAAAPAGSDAGTGVLVRVTTDVGEIFGVDGRSYDLSAGDVTVLPPDNATVLVEDGAAERLQSAVPFSGGRSSTRS